MRSAVMAVSVASSTACGLVTAPEPSPLDVPDQCGYRSDVELAYTGETTLEQAGLAMDQDHLQPRDRQLRGELYVTAGPAPFLSAPRDSELRGFCMIYPGGGLQMVQGLVPEDWEPPH